jgi:hypothetical protein
MVGSMDGTEGQKWWMKGRVFDGDGLIDGERGGGWGFKVNRQRVERGLNEVIDG